MNSSDPLPLSFELALEELSGFLDAIPKTALQPLPDCAFDAVLTVFSIGDRLAELRPDIVRLSGSTAIDLLPKAALATAAATHHDGEGERATRAYTLLYFAYEEVRRAVSFIRWYEADVAELLPALA